VKNLCSEERAEDYGVRHVLFLHANWTQHAIMCWSVTSTSFELIWHAFMLF